MSVALRRTCALLAAPVLTLGIGTVDAVPASAASTTVVISEAFGGGGNTGAPYKNDFVELFNRSTAPVDITGWKIQYFSASGTTVASSTTLSGTIAAGGHFLVQEAAGANTAATPLPAPDATGTIAMAAAGARVQIVDAAGAVVDLLGWGAATTAEGVPAAGTSNTTSVARTNPCVDTDDNASDFTVGAPTPENASTATLTCGTTPTDPSTTPPADPAETIAQIQGRSHLSPLAGKPVNGVEGVVTTVAPRGFWMQSTTPDDDPGTSEGIYVYTSAAPTVAVGDTVTVSGKVTEFRPGGTGGNDNLTTTEITAPVVTVNAHDTALPAPVVLGVDRIAPQQNVEEGDPKNVEYAGHLYRPETDAIDFYESLEGMRVAVRDAQVVGPTNSYGELPVVPGQNVVAVRSPRGGVVYSGYDHPNSMRVQLDDTLLPANSMPAANVGDTIPGDTVGVLDYTFANFKLFLTSVPTISSGGLTREVTTPVADDKTMAVATFNVENLSMSNPQEKFDRLARQIVVNLASPDVVALEEIQDDSGPADDGTVDSTKTVARLVAAVAAAGGPAYRAMWINPVDKADGGQPGGNIRQVFLYRTDRKLAPVPAPAGDATTPVDVVASTGAEPVPHLTLNPGRIAPNDPAFLNSRKPLAAEFVFRGKNVFVIANHFTSKGGDDPLFGRWQQPVRSSETVRHAQAQVVRDFVDKLLAVNAKARVLVVGDLNDFEFSRTADILVGSGTTAMTDLPRTLPAGERYTYVYEGNSQVLDHILMTPNLMNTMTKRFASYEYDIVHTNSEFFDQDSDHDPQVVKLTSRYWSD